MKVLSFDRVTMMMMRAREIAVQNCKINRHITQSAIQRRAQTHSRVLLFVRIARITVSQQQHHQSHRTVKQKLQHKHMTSHASHNLRELTIKDENDVVGVKRRRARGIKSGGIGGIGSGRQQRAHIEGLGRAAGASVPCERCTVLNTKESS